MATQEIVRSADEVEVMLAEIGSKAQELFDNNQWVEKDAVMRIALALVWMLNMDTEEMSFTEMLRGAVLQAAGEVETYADKEQTFEHKLGKISGERR